MGSTKTLKKSQRMMRNKIIDEILLANLDSGTPHKELLELITKKLAPLGLPSPYITGISTRKSQLRAQKRKTPTPAPQTVVTEELKKGTTSVLIPMEVINLLMNRRIDGARNTDWTAVVIKDGLLVEVIA